MNRRYFLKSAARAGAALTTAAVAQMGKQDPARPIKPSGSPDMQYRELGKTGQKVSAIGVGGWHLGLPKVDEQLAVRIVRTAIDNGVTFMDNSWDYHDGISELRMGRALKDGYRDKVFLMTKIDGRSRKEAARQIEASLLRLQVDYIDLLQHHEILRFDDPHRIFDPEGAQTAVLEAQKVGKIRYIGFTGHKDPAVHLYMLEVADQNGCDFDTVQMPLNVMDAHYRSFEKMVLPELVKRRIGVLGMKPLANGIILKSQTVSAVECLQYALTLPTSVVITGIDSMDILNQALEVMRTFQPLNQQQMAALLARTRNAALNGDFEPFKTSSIFDSTASHPAWLGDEPERLKSLMPI